MNHAERRELARLKARAWDRLLHYVGSDKRKVRRTFRRSLKAYYTSDSTSKVDVAFSNWLKKGARYHGK